MSANLSAIFYLISGVLFILALRGLIISRDIKTRKFIWNNWNDHSNYSYIFICWKFSSGFIYVLIFLAIGGSIGAFIAYKIPMTAMPELVAGFHSLVGLAAVFVAISAFIKS